MGQFNIYNLAVSTTEHLIAPVEDSGTGPSSANNIGGLSTAYHYQPGLVGLDSGLAVVLSILSAPNLEYLHFNHLDIFVWIRKRKQQEM